MKALEIKSENSLKELPELLMETKKYAELVKLQKMDLNLKFILFLIKINKWFVQFKLSRKIEKVYRKYGDHIFFREEMMSLFYEIYENLKDSMNDEQFIEYITSFGRSKEIKKLLKEDAEEAIYTYKLKESLNNCPDLKEALAKFGEIA
ncbi:MAG: hypothetical protein DSY34_01955 [Desulfurobacterium sp.]|nr:MAG: hypothetical protein DSY34_01955 [Desulfurobacterium sp.]